MNSASLWTRFKCALTFLILMVIPFPITSLTGFFVVIFRPVWFKKLVDSIYMDKNH